MFSEKFALKYMRLAKQIGEDQNPCYSRNIGSLVIGGFGSGKILGAGYNSPPRDTPHCDDGDYLRNVFWPQLTAKEKEIATASSGLALDLLSEAEIAEAVCRKYTGCKTCPRKIVGAASGTRLELCTCTHSEANAIVNCAEDLHGAVMFCWCPLPCIECAKLIVNSGIKTVYCYKIEGDADYSHGSRWLFEKGGVKVIEHAPEYYIA